MEYDFKGCLYQIYIFKHIGDCKNISQKLAILSIPLLPNSKITAHKGSLISIFVYG